MLRANFPAMKKIRRQTALAGKQAIIERLSAQIAQFKKDDQASDLVKHLEAKKALHVSEMKTLEGRV